jgi:hypothetical protein
MLYAFKNKIAYGTFSNWRTAACAQRSRLCAVGELTNCLPGTEAKLITKSRS